MESEKKFKYDLYNIYLYNLHTLINSYHYKYRWVDLSKERFFNHSGHSFTNFNIHDKFLQQYKEDKKQLGKAILRDGTYTPFFYFKNKDNYNMIMLGKHRLYSLLMCQLDKPLPRKFLFVEYPHDPLDGKTVHEQKITPTLPLYFFDHGIKEPEPRYPDCEDKINIVFLCTGDYLSDFFYTEKTQPSPWLNSPEAFEEFLQKPFEPNLNPRNKNIEI